MKEKIQDLSLTKRLELVEPLLEKDNYAEAWEMLKQIEILGDLKINSRERGIFYYLSSVALHGLGKFKESLEFGENAYELFKNTLENIRIAEVQFILGKSYLLLGRLKEAEDQFRDSVATCRRIGDDKGIVRNYNKLAQIYSIRADYPRAIEYLKECISYLEKIKDWINLSIIQRNLGRIYILRGELNLAEKHLLSDIRLLKEAGKEHILNLSRCLLSLGYIKLLKREFKRSSTYLRRAYELLKDNKSPRDLAIYYEYQGEAYFLERKFDEADAYYKKALQIGEEIAPQGALISQTCRLLADLALQRKEIDKAFEFINKSLEVSRVIGEKLEEGIGYRILGEIYHQKNEEDKSREAFDKSIKSLEETGARYEQIKTYLCLSFARGFDYPEKLSFLEKSKKLSSGLGLKYLEALSEFTHSQLEFERENFENSLYALNRAEHLFSEPPEEDKLQLCRELREKIEKNLSQKSISADNEFKLFRKYLSDTEYKELEEGGLEESLKLLAGKIKAERGFIVYNKSSADEFSFPSLYNMESDKARFVSQNLALANFLNPCADTSECDSYRPLILTHPSSVKKIMENGKINSLLLIPLLCCKNMCGFIYLDRTGGISPFTQQELNFAVAFADLLALKISEFQKKDLQEDNLRLKKLLEERCSFSQILTRNNQILKILWKLEQIKDTNLSVLFEGETGVGKDFLAKALHYSSNRKDKNFIAVNCAALPETLLESELFGHKKGSYTGAAFDKKGLFEEADGGTLYLDELGDLSLSIQVKLLRALEEKIITRLGEIKPRKIDIRVIASTNKNLEEEVSQGRFRKDLYFRLNTINLKIPPLRERKEDIPILVEHFIKTHSNGDKKSLSIKPVILELYSEYDWPGNVRELENETKRLLAYNQSGDFVLDELLSDKFPMARELKNESSSLYDKISLLEKQYILKALIENNWIKKSAARTLRIPESSLRFKMKQYKIQNPAR